MIIWILGLLLVASVAATGYRQGVIRVAFSFLGIIAGVILAVPLGRLVDKLLGIPGIKDPLWLWALGPIIAFIIVSAAFKVGAFYAHQKVDVYYKYHAGDLRLALWERLSSRLGLCLGLLNGVLYAVLLAFVIYVPSYAAVQFHSSDEDPRWLRWTSALGQDLHSTGMDKVARSIDGIPETDYRMVDLAALLYRNPLAEARVVNYPGFLVLAELPEFAGMSTDTAFTGPWAQQMPIMQFLETPRLANIRHNPELLKTVWTTVAADLQDFNGYLKTGRSAKYDAIKILGRWNFNVSSAIRAVRLTKPRMSSREMQALRQYMESAFGQTRLVVRPDHSVSLKNAPGLALANAAQNPTTGPQSLDGKWQDLNEGKYLLSFSGTDLTATVDGDRLAFKSQNMEMAFNREY